MDPMSKDKAIERRGPEIRDEIDGVKFRTLAKGITTHPLVRGGRPCIEGTGILVTTIAGLQKFHSMDAEKIADNLWIERFMVDDALAYYAAHTDYIDTCLELNSMSFDQMVESHYGDFSREILSRRESVAGDR